MHLDVAINLQTGSKIDTNVISGFQDIICVIKATVFRHLRRRLLQAIK